MSQGDAACNCGQKGRGCTVGEKLASIQGAGKKTVMSTSTGEVSWGRWRGTTEQVRSVLVEVDPDVIPGVVVE
ncbi:hypothetical protein CENSYa_1097 [Cenarchaeum symbiosum A]|uniref:Uncharacterized protein n=1 Tax=Cenarchaeum symbiosum (strain A) TaxID=414004 RepID=A0RWK9_CENSY|nr:hypothetical protein CENSYa_1097 [Cenarchaeum symbiosum A]